MLGDLFLGQVAQAALSARGAAVRAEWEGIRQAATEVRAEVALGRVLPERIFGLGTESGDEFLHLPAVLTLAGGLDQAVDAVDKGPVASVDLGIAYLIAALPT